jgi:hypothetical protein
MIKTADSPVWEREPPSQKDIVHALNVRKEMLEDFRELWYQSYLLGLRQQYKDLHDSNWTNKIKVDDVVLVQLPNKSRPYWVLGRVLSLIEGSDEKVRSANIKRGDGHTQLHSLKHLYPLELATTHSYQPTANVDTNDDLKEVSFQESDGDKAEINNNDSLSGSSSTRPIRQAGEKCKQRLRNTEYYKFVTNIIK